MVRENGGTNSMWYSLVSGRKAGRDGERGSLQALHHTGSKSIIDKHTKGRMGTELEERSRMGNLWLMMIGHAVRQEVEGILVRSRACGGRGCEYDDDGSSAWHRHNGSCAHR